MDKAEFDFLSKSIQAEYMERMSAAVRAFAFNDSSEKQEIDRCCVEHIAAAELLNALNQAAPEKTTRESLLQLATQDVFAFYLPLIGDEKTETVIKAVTELLASIPTPETLMTGSVKESVLMRAKVIKCLPGIPITQEHEAAAAVNVGTDKKKVYVDVGLLTEIAPIAPRLTVFDLSVMQAAASIFNSGSKTFSTNQLYRVLTGADAHTKITSKATLKATKKSLATLQATIITIDASRQATFGGYSKICWKETKFTGCLLPMSKIETAYYSKNGLEATCDCWRILDKPPLLAYTTTINHIATIPQEVKRLPEGIYITVNNICIRDTLLYYICLNKGKGKKLNYSTLIEAAGVDVSNREKYRRIKNTVDSFLQYWQKIGFISDRTDVIEGSQNDTIYIS